MMVRKAGRTKCILHSLDYPNYLFFCLGLVVYLELIEFIGHYVSGSRIEYDLAIILSEPTSKKFPVSGK